MFVFQKVTDLQAWLNTERSKGRSIGFAPTMGALHAGHMGLVQMALEACDLAVVSIFVNPTQFNDPKDLEKYPRTPELDVLALEQAGCHAVLMPNIDEIYPPGQDITVQLNFGALDAVMEGIFRPGHFKGMATVVKRLLDIFQPDRLFMGQKDYQQLSIVREMLRQLHSPVILEMCPTTREPDGLAMSSRNVRLSPEMRALAPLIYQTLLWARTEFVHSPARVLEQKCIHILKEAGFQPEYFELVDGLSLQKVDHWEDSPFIVACVAVFAAQVRLIDNLVIKGNP